MPSLVTSLESRLSSTSFNTFLGNAGVEHLPSIRNRVKAIPTVALSGKTAARITVLNR
jgi:hypothetical protein